MKNRIIILFAVFLFASVGYAQEKLFKRAIKEGRQPTQFYMVDCGNKMVHVDDLMEFVTLNDYILGDYSTKEIQRFGDIDISVATFEFLPKSEYNNYICENFLPSEVYSIDASNNGSAYIFVGMDANPPFVFFDNIIWNGTINNGRLEGDGKGYVIKNAKIYYITGQFHDGFPVSSTSTYVYKIGSNYSLYDNNDSGMKSSITLGRMNDGMASFKRGELFGFFRNDGTIAISPTYQEIVSDFSDGYAAVLLDGREVKIDKKGTVVGITDHQKELDEEAARLAEEQKRREQERLAEEQKRREQERLAEERRQVEESKKRKAELAQWTKRFGFNPQYASLRTIIKEGRSFSLVKEWFSVCPLYVNYGRIFIFRLVRTEASAGCYKILTQRGWDTSSLGYVWVRGDRIISVQWY